jgi:hypothetical protein
MSAGKGDRPRNCFSKKFRDNYQAIIWNKTKKEKQKVVKGNKTIIKYP